MKIYDTRRSNGRLLPFKVRDQHVWYTTDNMPYPDALAKIQKTVNRFKKVPTHSRFYIDDSVSRSFGRNYKKYDLNENNSFPNTLVKDKGTFYIQTQIASNKHYPPKPKSPYWRQLDYNYRGRCVIIDDGRKQSSPYGYTYDDLSQMLRNNDYHEYIQDGDYLKLTIGDYIYTMRFNIDTYYDYSIKAPFADSIYIPEGSIPHHIDMLSDEVFATPMNYNRGYFSDDIAREYIDNKYGSGDRLRLRGTLDSDDHHPMNFFQFVDEKFYRTIETKFSDNLKKHIRPKTGKGYSMDIMYNPRTIDRELRFQSMDNFFTDVVFGNVWQLSEAEIFGHTIHGLMEDVSSDIQYPTCRMYGSQRSFPVHKSMDIPRRLSEYRLYTTTTMDTNSTRTNYGSGTVRVAGNGVPYSKNASDVSEGKWGNDLYYTLNFRFI